MSKAIEGFAKRRRVDIGRPLKPYELHLIRDYSRYLETEFGIEIMDKGSVSDTFNLVEPQSYSETGKIAFISEEIGHLTGGRYYAWFVACALVALGYDVTLYTNQEPVYIDAFRDYKKPKVKIIPKDKLDSLDVEADMYFSSPLLGDIAVCKMAQKYNKPCYIMVFDPIPMQLKYTGGQYSGWNRLTPLIKGSGVKILSLADSCNNYIYEWLNKRPDQITTLYPCINTLERNKAEIKPREDYVVFISRLVKHKKFDDVLDAVKKVGVKLKVISSNDGIGVDKLMKEYGLTSKDIEFCFNADDKTKFEIIASARAVINPSIFEGFGMWAIEALSCGTPLVCYDFETIKEIAQFAKAENFYFAKWGDKDDLAVKLQQALDEKKYTQQNKDFEFDAMKSKLSGMLSTEPKIAVITIALNEEQFIGASLASTTKQEAVKKVVVIEGAVNLFAHAATKDGLSLDNTAVEVMNAMTQPDGEKIVYERYGWANDKSELRNHALKMLPDDITHVLVVDADEVWKTEEFEILVKNIKKNPKIGVFLFNFNHFFKKTTQIATGGQWESQMFRCFKYTNKNLHWENHGAPVVDQNHKFINVTDGAIEIPNIRVYHYGYCKSEKNVMDKLEYYKKRDTHLDVQPTIYKDWAPGKETQPTHGGGSVTPFTGEHPPEIMNMIKLGRLNV